MDSKKKLVLVKGCGKCFYKEVACFFFPILREKRRTAEVKHCRRREMCNSYAVALLVKVSVEWIASVQEITHNSRYSVGTVHVIMLWRENRRVRRLWHFVFQFGREKGERETQETGYEAQGTTERRKKGAEMPAFVWTTAFLFLLSSRLQSDVPNEPPKTANRAWMTTPLRSTSFYTPSQRLHLTFALNSSQTRTRIFFLHNIALFLRCCCFHAV